METAMNPQTTYDNASAGFVLPREEAARARAEQDLWLESCADLERIVVKTQSSVYELVVLCSKTGDVVVRGGRFFPEFRCARVAGSVFGGSAVKLRHISVGLHLELHVNGRPFVTSRIEGISRDRTQAGEAA